LVGRERKGARLFSASPSVHTRFCYMCWDSCSACCAWNDQGASDRQLDIPKHVARRCRGFLVEPGTLWMPTPHSAHRARRRVSGPTAHIGPVGFVPAGPRDHLRFDTETLGSVRRNRHGKPRFHPTLTYKSASPAAGTVSSGWATCPHEIQVMPGSSRRASDRRPRSRQETALPPPA